MASGPWVMRSKRVVTPSGVRAADVVILGERIERLADHDSTSDGTAMAVIDVGDRVVLPGLVDLHVHINEPGRTEWEGFTTATRAAAAGGITTLVDMPLNSSPVTTTTAALALKKRAADGKLWVDCGFHGGIVPGNAGEIGPLVAAGVLGFKAFLCDSGIDEFPAAGEDDLRAAMPEIARAGLRLLAHAEIAGPAPEPPTDDPRSYAAHLASRPAAWEVEAIRRLIGLARETGCPIHIVHLATPEALPLIAEALRDGVAITVETCPHYLFFAAEEIPDGDTRFKCAPPIRTAADRDGLWDGLRSGLIRTIGSDHSPAPPALKQRQIGDLRAAWGGIASLQLSLPAVWTEARRRGFTVHDLALWMAENPAKLLGPGNRKGAIVEGHDADLVVFDPDATFTVRGDQLQHRHPDTPYEGQTLTGVVEATFLRGSQVYDSGEFFLAPRGRILNGSARPDLAAGLARLNAMAPAAARAALLDCCGSTWWADQMVAARPFVTEEALDLAADRIWRSLDRADRLEAFRAHPRIGDLDALRHKLAATEQGAVAGADEATLRDLAEGNRRFEERFGHIFLICATGKSAPEMLQALRDRLVLDPDAEFAAASAEQAKITHLRLRNLLR